MGMVGSSRKAFRHPRESLTASCASPGILARVAISSCLWLVRTIVVDRARLISRPLPPFPNRRLLASQCLLGLGLADTTTVPLALLRTYFPRWRRLPLASRLAPHCCRSTINRKQPPLGTHIPSGLRGSLRFERPRLTCSTLSSICSSFPPLPRAGLCLMGEFPTEVTFLDHQKTGRGLVASLTNLR